MRALALVLLLAAGPAVAAAPSPEAVSKKEQGDGRRDAGDATGALAAYKEATQASPDYIEAWEEIGKLYFGAKKFPEAAESFQRAVEIDGSYANNWFNLALARRRAGQLDRARDAFRRYVLLKPDDADGRLRLADVLRALDDRDGAIKEYEAVVVAADARTATPQQGERAKEAIAQLRAAGAPARTVTIVPVSPVAPTPAAPVASVPTAPAPTPAESPAPAVTAAPVPAVAPAVPPAVVPPPSAPAAPPPRLEPVAPPSPALLDKLALGERLQASGDHRGALFAFQDAVYLEPRNALARVKLGRAYWMLRYVGQADEQWQQAMQLAPNDPSIARMIEDARKAPRPAIAEPAPSGNAAAPAAAEARPPAEAPRVYRFVPEGQGVPAQPAAPQYGATTPGYGLPPAQSAPVSPPTYAPPSAQPSYPPASYGQQAYPPQQQAYPPQQPAYPQPPVEQPSSYPPAQQPWAQQPAYGQQPQAQQPYAQPQYGQPQYPQPAYPAQQPVYAQPPAPVPQQPSASAAAAAQHYRAALSLYIQRDYLGAIAELDASITLDPNLSVAYTARGSAKFGLRKYREAAADYKAAIDLDTTRAEPIWGLAECQRMLGDPAAVDTYRRYAASIASDVNEDRRSKARRWATELSAPSK